MPSPFQQNSPDELTATNQDHLKCMSMTLENTNVPIKSVNLVDDAHVLTKKDMDAERKQQQR